MIFFSELRKRNQAFHDYGWLCAAGCVICLLLAQFTTTAVLGLNAFYKPAKFFFSVSLFCWTMGWILFYLNKQQGIKTYTRWSIGILSYELLIITGQAARGQQSHFNVSNLLNSILFQGMGLAIVTLVLWTVVFTVRFFRQQTFLIPAGFVWGIRLGLVAFIIFSLEGGVMGYEMAHTVGAADGGPGMHFANWSTRHGDLRVAHFFGIHALQLLPLIGWILRRNKVPVIAISVLYIAFTAAQFMVAMEGKPFGG